MTVPITTLTAFAIFRETTEIYIKALERYIVELEEKMDEMARVTK